MLSRVQPVKAKRYLQILVWSHEVSQLLSRLAVNVGVSTLSTVDKNGRGWFACFFATFLLFLC